MAASDYDVAVVGGGLVGVATAWGLAREGCRVVVLDEGDRAVRASRGNFALVWVQSKGLGLPEYAGAFAETGIDVSVLRHLLRHPPGAHSQDQRLAGVSGCRAANDQERRQRIR